MSISSSSAPSSSSGVVSTARSTRWCDVPTPSRRATQGRVGAWTRVKMTTSTKTRSKIHAHARGPDGHRHGREHDGHGTAQPGPRQEGLGAPRHPERRHDTSTDSGRPSSSRAAPTTSAGTQHVEEPRRARRAARAARTARSAPATRWPWRTRCTAGAVREPQVAEHEGREVAGEEAGGVQRRRRRHTRARRRTDDADGEQRRRRRGHEPQQPRAPAQPTASPTTAPPDQLERRR